MLYLKQIKTIMKHILFLLFLPAIMMAQEINDPKAEKLITQLQENYSSFSDFSAHFDVVIEIPESDNETHSGVLYEKGSKFNLLFDKSRIICDGNALWNYLADENEIQINDYEEGESDLFLTPRALMAKIKKGDLIYALMNSKSKTKTIEFKPKDREEDFFKIKVNIKNKLISNIQLFYKNGVRYKINLKDMKSDQSLKDDLFVLNKADYPNASIEDLRL